jgi:hypothetical protein
VSDLLRVNKAVLPWLFPLALVLVVLAVAFAPSPVIGVLGVVVFLALGYVAVPLLYYRRYQRRSDRNDIAR